MIKKFAMLGIAILLISPCLGIIADARSNEMDTVLTSSQKAIIPIAAFAADGNTEKLEQALGTGLSAGLSVNAIKEILIQLYAYAGFPRSLTALETFRKLVENRKSRGIKDATGPEPKQLPANADKYEIGGKIQTGLVGRPVAGPIYEFAPAMDVFLKEHLFCDIFTRNIISAKDRELATISVLAALPAPAQLASHLRVCLNIGLTESQLREAGSILTTEVSRKAGELVSDLLDKAVSVVKKEGK
ncbi:MAG: 4-carboxymuconolactone decarboxylase [Desulfovibrio sp.]|nr:4-carboxymuconolactone decarboxylase [Desulfovibrio sp.]